MADAEKPGVLSGIRVLDFTQYIAGPILGRMLADLGAEVIKLELAPIGDYMRRQVPAKDGLGAGFIADNRGKKSVCFNIKRPEALDIIKDLVRRSDVLVENFTPGVLAKYGVSYAALQPLNPRLIMCSISGFGQTGPYAHKPGNDLITWASSGLLDLCGYPDDTPVYPGANIGDCTGGVHALAAINAALFFRERTGAGQYIDIALMECLAHYNSLGIAMIAMTGGKVKPVRWGAHSNALVPFGIYQARDGYLVISVLFHQWETFAKLMGKPELATDPRFDSAEKRTKNKPEVIKLTQEWVQSFATRDEVLAALDSAHILHAPVLETTEVINDPHTRAREFLQTIDQPGVGRFALPKAPMHFSAATVEIPGPAPMLGEHNQAVLSDVAGYTKARIDALSEAGVLFEEPVIAALRARGELR